VTTGTIPHDHRSGERPSIFDTPQLDDVTWRSLMAELRPMLPGDIAAIESFRSRQLAHYDTGIRITCADDVVYISSSYSLVGYSLGVVTEKLRDLSMSCEMITGRTATSVIFDQPGMVTADLAGRPRLHGYALFGADGGPTMGAGGTLALPASELSAFDRHVLQRNAG
jgi:hypothetical protein